MHRLLLGSYGPDGKSASLVSDLAWLYVFLSSSPRCLAMLPGISSLCSYRVQWFQQGSLATSATQARTVFGACRLVLCTKQHFLFCSLYLVLSSVLVCIANGCSTLFFKLCFLSLRIEFLRHLRSFFQIMFKIETKAPEEEYMGGEKVLMTCVGIGFSNLSKTIR